MAARDLHLEPRTMWSSSSHPRPAFERQSSSSRNALRGSVVAQRDADVGHQYGSSCVRGRKPSKPRGCRSETLTPTREAAEYCAGDVAGERGEAARDRDRVVDGPEPEPITGMTACQLVQRRLRPLAAFHVQADDIKESAEWTVALLHVSRAEKASVSLGASDSRLSSISRRQIRARPHLSRSRRGPRSFRLKE